MSEYDCVGVTSEYLDSLKNKIAELEQQKAELIECLKSIQFCGYNITIDEIKKSFDEILNKYK